LGTLGNVFGGLFNFNSSNKKIDTEIKLVGPITKSAIFENVYLPYNVFLFFAILLITFLIFKERFGEGRFYGSSKEVQTIYKKIKKTGLNYSELFNLLSRLDKDNQMMLKGIGMDLIIAESSLSKDAKRYFKLALDQCEKIKFKGESASATPKLEKKYFEELLRLL
jgi:DNA-directed RNA polymerase beta' subunit